MKLLHTSDLHLGKRLMERDRLPEQIEVLEEIASICDRENVSVVLVAGDVFDTYLPSAEAEEAFYRSFKRLSERGRAVVAVSGNHDDGVRLTAGAPLAEEQGIYLFGGAPRVFPTGRDRAVRAVETGENYLVLENADGERVYINALPYPNEARLKEGKTEESYAEKTARWIARGDAGYRGDMPHVLLSHLFVAGGKTAESERDIGLGGARAVPVHVLPKEGYVALGHLHRRQTVGPARYSGSILQYAFDEANAEKSVVLLETEGLGFHAREIPLTAGKRLVRLECASVDEALELLPLYRDKYVELTLRLSAPLTTRETEALGKACEGLVSLIPKLPERGSAPAFRRAALSGGELFTEFCRSVTGEAPSEELSRAFLALLEEA